MNHTLVILLMILFFPSDRSVLYLLVKCPLQLIQQFGNVRLFFFFFLNANWMSTTTHESAIFYL